MSSDKGDWERVGKAFVQFCQTIAALRDPDTGCPWDLQQDHKSLRRYMIEEAYEAAEAMDFDDHAEIRDELGDVLLQVVLNAQVAADRRTFSIAEVIESINAKMQRRHPHVFGDADRSLDSIKATWQEIKEQERAAKANSEAPSETSRTRSVTFAKAYRTGPATVQAYKIGKIAATIAFDWPTAKKVFQQLESEVAELRAEVSNQKADVQRIASEIGDVYFTLSQLCRHYQLEPEVVALAANDKFLRRFARVEQLAREKELVIESLDNTTLERLWQEAKSIEKGGDRT